MKPTFTTRIFRSILPWMAVLFLLASSLFFYYQAKVFIEEKTEDMEVLIADRAHDVGNQAACAADTASDGAPEEPDGARRY